MRENTLVSVGIELMCSWCGAVLWIQDENNIENTSVLTFQSLLSSAYTKSKTFQLTKLPCQPRADGES